MDTESQNFNDWLNRKQENPEPRSEISWSRRIMAQDLQDATEQINAVREELKRFLREFGRWE